MWSGCGGVECLARRIMNRLGQTLSWLWLCSTRIKIARMKLERYNTRHIMVEELALTHHATKNFFAAVSSLYIVVITTHSNRCHTLRYSPLASLNYTMHHCHAVHDLSPRLFFGVVTQFVFPNNGMTHLMETSQISSSCSGGYDYRTNV